MQSDLYLEITEGGETMDLLSNAWSALVSAWDTLWSIADGFMNPALFVSSLVTLALAVLLFSKTSNTILNYIVVLFLGAAAYSLLVSIDVIGRTRFGASVALLVAIIAIFARIGVIWQQAGQPGKAFTILAVVGLVLALMSVVGSFTPTAPVIGGVNAVIARTGDFANQLFSNVQEGAERIR